MHTARATHRAIDRPWFRDSLDAARSEIERGVDVVTPSLEMVPPRTLLVFEAVQAGGAFAQRVLDLVGQHGYRAFLRAAGEDVDCAEPEVVDRTSDVVAALIDLDAPNPLLVARRVRLHSPQVPIVFVGGADAARALRQDLSVEILIGTNWSVASWSCDELLRVLDEFERESARRREMTVALETLNRRLAEAPSVDPLERSADGNDPTFSATSLGATVESADGALIWTDRRGRVLNWSAAAEDVFGWNERDASQRYVPTLAGGAWPIELLTILEQTRGGRSVLRRAFQLERADGSCLDVEVDANPSRDARGGVAAIAVLVRDVTARRGAQVTQQGSRDTWLRLAQEVAGLGAWEWDIARGVVAWSPNVERLHGLPVGTFAGTFAAHLECTHADDRARLESALQTTLQRGGEHRVEHRVVWPDGTTHWIEDRGAVLRDRQGRAQRFVGLSIDIDERKQLQMELGRRVRELALTDQRKNEFLAMLAHELRNPLAPIRNAVGVLDENPASEETAQWARDVIRRQVSHLSRLIDDLLDVNRLTTGKIELRMETVDVAAIVSNAIETSRPLIESSGHELRIALPREPLFVHADSLRLAQVFANLLNNSAKYTHPGGHITLTVEQELGGIRVSIEDDGVGIPPDMIAKVFEMFVQVDRSLEKERSGLGIGLAIAKTLIEMHGGRVEARSAGLGCGSAFIIHLPRATAPAENRSSGGGGNGMTHGKGLRILVADDNQDSALSLALMLKIIGHETEIAHDGEQALAVADRFLPQVVVLDLGMPKLNGYDACTRIRERPWGKEALLIAVTGWGQDEDRRRSREAGFDHHLVKPLDPGALRDLLTQWGATHADTSAPVPRGDGIAILPAMNGDDVSARGMRDDASLSHRTN